MNTQSIHHSHWLQQTPLDQRFPRFEGNHETEILIMGAGITGLSVALELLSRGRKVIVCDAEVVGAGTTGGSSGHLDAHPEQGPSDFIRRLGEGRARACTRLRLDAIRRIEQIAGDQCHFRTVPAYRYSEDDSHRNTLYREFEAAQQIGLDAEWVESVSFPQARAGYRIQGMGRIDCMKYLKCLSDAVVERGGVIYEHSPVKTSAGEQPVSAQVGDGRIRFDHFVSAVHCNGSRSLSIDAQLPPYQSYVIAARVAEPPEDALYWDDSDPYYYVRRANSEDDRLLLIGGCDHRTGAADSKEAITRLQEWARARFDVDEILNHWSAELFEPVDRLPLIGRIGGRKNVWIATGLSGIGLTWGTAAAQIIADQIDHKYVTVGEALSPARFGLSGVVRFASEQVTTAANLAKRVLPAKEIHPEELAPGEGAVGMVAGEHVAICRDQSGCLHACRPICTHMGGVVQWNAVEQTWDCPVHGGRFSAEGERIYGPPQSDLDEIVVQLKEPAASGG